MEPLQQNQSAVKAWKPFNPVPNAHYIAESIKDIPEHLALTPLQDKQPKRLEWQTEPPVPRALIYDLIVKGEKAISQKNGKEYTRFWSGFGVRTGDISNGLLTIDIDGHTALPLLLAILETDELPHTVAWKSGKPGRLQLAFQVPEQYREALKDFTRRVTTEYKGLRVAHDDEGKPLEFLEFRYNGCQSVLPPSRHPQTGQYQWINSFNKTPVAELPEKLCQFLLNLAIEQKKCDEEKERLTKERLLQQQQRKEECKRSGKKLSPLDFLEFEVLPRLNPEQIYNWSGHNFRAFGKTLKGAPPWRASQSGTSFHVWWDGQQWAWTDKAENSGGDAVNYRYRLKGGTGYPKGNDFIEIVKELADDAGLEMPSFELEPDSELYDKHCEREKEEALIKKLEKENRLTSSNSVESVNSQYQHESEAFLDETSAEANTYNEIKKYLENFKEEERTKAGKPKKKQHTSSLDKYENKVLETQLKLNSLTYKPDIELNEEFLPQDLYTRLPCSGIVAIKSRKASGKSSAVLKPLIWGLKWQKKKIISITPRLVLGGEQCVKFDITWVDEFSEEKLAVGVCWDSLHKLMHIDWDAVIIDEARAGLKHLVTANTAIKKNRPLILSCFSNQINKVTQKGGLVLMCDADLTDVEMNYVKEVAHEGTPIFTVINHHKGLGQNIEFQIGKNDIIEEEILDDIRQQCEEFELTNDESKYRPFIIASDSQAELEALEQQIYEQIPQLRAEYDWPNLSRQEKQKIIDKSKKAIRIDKKTTETSFGKNFVRNPDEAVQNLKPLVFSYSPTMAYGVSIEKFHFTKIYGLYTGVLEPCEFRQQLKRYRPDVPVKIWAIERNDNYNSACNSPLPDVIKETVSKNTTDAAEPDIIDFATQIARQKCNGDAQSFLKILSELLEENKWDNAHINLWANIQARSNFAKPRCALILLQELKELENARITLRMASNSSFGENIKQQKKEDKFESAKIMYEGFNSDWTPEDARGTLNDSNTSWETRLHAEGVLMKDFLPGVELTPDFIFERKLRDVNWLSNQYLYWLLNNLDVAKALDAKKWEQHCSKWNVFGTIFLPDLSLKAAKIKLLQDLQILKLVNTEGDFSDNSPVVKNVMVNAFKNRDRVRRLFNLSLAEGKTKPIKFIGKLLEKIGLSKKMSRSDGKKRFYMIYGADCPDRVAVLKAWDEKYAGYGLNDETLERFTPTPELTHHADIYKENADVSVPPQVDTTPAPLTHQTCIYKEKADVSVDAPLTETTSTTHTTSATTSHQTTVFEHLPELTHQPVIYKEKPDVSVDENTDFSDLIAISDREIKRLGWSRDKAHQYLKDAFGRRSRLLMTDAEMLEFVRSLKSFTGREFYYVGQEFTTTVTAKNDRLWSDRINVNISKGIAFKEVFCNLADACWTFVTHELLKGYNPLSLKLSDLQLVH